MTPNQYALALHTTTRQLGLAINNFQGDHRCQTWDLGRELSSHLHQYLLEFLAPQGWDDLAFLAVAKGPGGFTGTRIGVVTARTLAQQRQIPVFAISTLAAIAWSEKDQAISNTFAVQMEARRGQFFVGIYQLAESGLRTELSDTTMTPEAWQETLNNLQIPFQLIEAPSVLGSTASSILDLAYRLWEQGERPSWSQALPFYGQHPVEGAV
ncbi:MAG: tRNA (adenosine(37)-N6)-threonylcarbamoyltransferase complex dimerization subunit type 1 TsaB [Cyanobacteriota bacterium]